MLAQYICITLRIRTHYFIFSNALSISRLAFWITQNKSYRFHFRDRVSRQEKSPWGFPRWKERQEFPFPNNTEKVSTRLVGPLLFLIYNGLEFLRLWLVFSWQLTHKYKEQVNEWAKTAIHKNKPLGSIRDVWHSQKGRRLPPKQAHCFICSPLEEWVV